LKIKIFSSTLENALAFHNAGVVAVNLKVVGLAPVLSKSIKKPESSFKVNLKIWILQVLDFQF
jgi:hypothetical protein